MVAETSALQRGFLLRQKDRKVGDDNKIQSKSSLEIKSGFLLKKKPIAKDIATSRQATSTPSKNHPFSNKTANSDCGFAKGFLVSKTRSKSQKKPQIKVSKQHNEASKDLMNLEYPSAAQTTSSLFVLEKETSKPINPQKPLISVLDHDGSTPTRHAPLSLPSRPLISIVGDDDHKANLPCDGDEMNDDGILFQERTTTFYPSRRQMVVGEPLMMEVTTPMKSMPQSNSKRMLMSTLNNSSGPTPSNGTIATSFLKFQQELAKLKWKETETTNIDFIVSSWSHTQASWAWQYLFSLKRTTHQSLIDSILHHHPATVRDWLVSETPQDRTQALQLIQWIQEYLIRPEHLFRSRADAATDPLCADTWLDTVLPSLSALIDQRRTVLAQEGWTTCMVLLSRCTCRASAPSMDILDRLLNIQIVWKQAKKKSPKNQAQITLLQDWIQTNQSSSEKSTHWQKQVSGIPLDDCLGFGGLVHLFCSDAMSSRGLIFKDLSKPWKLLCEMAEHSNNSSILWRGILAHLSTLKQLESETQTDIVENVMTMLSKIKKRSDCILAISILCVPINTSLCAPAMFSYFYLTTVYLCSQYLGLVRF